MEVEVHFFLAWCLFAATAIAPIGCHGAVTALEAGNATVPRWCHGGECLIAYRQPEVELMAELDPENALGGMLVIKAGDVVNGAVKINQANCSRLEQGRYTPCVPEKNSGARYSPYNRAE